MESSLAQPLARTVNCCIIFLTFLLPLVVYAEKFREHTTGFDDNPTLIVEAGNPFVVPFSLSNTAPFLLRGTVTTGTATSFQWTMLSGPSPVTLTNATAQNATVSNIQRSGHYRFEFTGRNGTAVAKDTVAVWIRNMMEKNSEANPGPGRKFYLGGAQGPKVGKTDIYLPYINRDRVFGTTVKGGDTIVLQTNPNNNGIWWRVTIGDFGGTPDKPVVVVPEDVFRIGGNAAYMKISTGSNWTNFTDSNVVCYAKFDGLANRLSKGITYGFQFDGGGFYAEMIHHVELCGFHIRNTGHGFQIKINSGIDSLNYFRLFDHVRLSGLHLHDIFVARAGFEAFYLGNTDIAGNLQSGNDGPVPIGDSLIIERIIMDSISMDGIQISNFGNNAIIRDVLAHRMGVSGTPGHNWTILLGGNTQGRVYDNVIINARGPMGTLGKGRVDIYDNIVDSANGGTQYDDNMYVNQALRGINPPPDPLQTFTYRNIVSRIAPNRGIFHTNYSNTMIPGAIQDNIMVDPTRTLTRLIASQAKDKIQNNILRTAINLDTTRLAQLPAYKLYKLVRNNPGVMYSFFDVVVDIPGPLAVRINDGQPIEIKWPVNSVSLNAYCNRDSKNFLYKWRQMSGPAPGKIISPNAYSSVINDLKKGTYDFQISVFEGNVKPATARVRVTVVD